MSNSSSTPGTHAPLRRITGVRIVSTGTYLPDEIVTNADLQVRHGFDPDWIVQRTGIHARRHLPLDLTTSDMAVRAGRQAIERAGIDPAEIDLVIVGTFTADMTTPSTACLVQHQLGLQAGAFDLSAACAGFVYALSTAMQFVATGNSKKALVIGADCNSRVVNPKDQKIYPLFGDGAGAVILAPGDSDQGLISYTLGSDGGGGPILCRRLGGTKLPFEQTYVDDGWQFLYMDGRTVFKWAVRLVEDSVTDVLKHAGMTADDLDLIVLHQANRRIIDAAAETLELNPDKVLINLDRYGNTSAASIPIALDEALSQGRIHRGSQILISGFGAGLAWGTGILRW